MQPDRAHRGNRLSHDKVTGRTSRGLDLDRHVGKTSRGQCNPDLIHPTLDDGVGRQLYVEIVKADCPAVF